MRDAFITALTGLAEDDKDIVLLTGDLGFGVFEEFESRFPGQYFNVGIAEQNMMGLASGLSKEGKKVIAYSIGNFASLRCLEQIRNDACYHDTNITIVASGGGFSYGSLGMSHHTTEDLAIMRALPGMVVVAPCTKKEAFEATIQLVTSDGVGYLRLDKSAAEDSSNNRAFVIGRSEIYREGEDLTLISAGGILEEVIAAGDQLAVIGLKVKIVGIHTVKPIDTDEILKSSRETGGLVVIEEHNKDGGLGSAVAEVCMDHGEYPSKFLRIGLDNTFSSIVGGQKYLRQRYKIDHSAIVSSVRKLLNI
jgi:transketolase